MTSCCHCGRTLYYERSVKRGCGYWCFTNKGCCEFNYDRPDNEVNNKSKTSGEFKRNLIKGIAKGAIIGAALGVTCVLFHPTCIIIAFVRNHYYLKSAALTIYSTMKNKREGDEHPVKESEISGTMDTLNTVGINELSSRFGIKFAEIANERNGVSLSWAKEIGKETGKGMIAGGSNAIFDWGSKAVV